MGWGHESAEAPYGQQSTPLAELFIEVIHGSIYLPYQAFYSLAVVKGVRSLLGHFRLIDFMCIIFLVCMKVDVINQVVIKSLGIYVARWVLI